MAGAASIAWLPKGGTGIINRIGSSSSWTWGIIFTLHWGKGELEELDCVVQASIELLSLIIDEHQQNEASECFV